MPRYVCHLIDRNIDTAYFRSIARFHDNRRYPVLIGSLAPSGPLQQAMHELQTPTFALGAGSRWQYPMALARLVAFLRCHGVGLVHAHCFDPTCLGLVAARLAGVPFVFTRHHSDHHIRLDKVWHIRLDAWCARRADAVIAVSEATRRLMIEIEKVPPGRLFVVYNGMEPLPAPSARGADHLRKELVLDGAPVLLMVARLHEEKGHRYLFDALPNVQAQVGSCHVLLAGDGPHQAELQAQVQQRGLGNMVHFLGRRSDIHELIGLASVVVLPSLAESFGFAVLEAMSLGKPVVASSTGGLPEVVVHGESGLLVPQKDSKALAAAICRLLLCPELGQQLGNGGQRRAALFTFEQMIRGYERVYDRVLAARC